MSVFRDGVIAFFSAVGMTTVVWLLAGAVLHAGRPTIPGLLLVLPVRGEALALEHDVRELRRVRGGLPGARIVIADCGLTAEARGLADYLADREDNAAVVDGADFRLDAENERYRCRSRVRVRKDAAASGTLKRGSHGRTDLPGGHGT